MVGDKIKALSSPERWSCSLMGSLVLERELKVVPGLSPSWPGLKGKPCPTPNFQNKSEVLK